MPRSVEEGGRQVVELKAAKLPGDRPILLHELLHAYHGQKLGPTPMIRDSYQQAVRSTHREIPAAVHCISNRAVRASSLRVVAEKEFNSPGSFHRTAGERSPRP